MSLVDALSIFLSLNLLLVVAYLALKLAAPMRKGLSAQAELKLHYALLSLVFLIALSQPLLPRQSFFEPAAKVWSAPSSKNSAAIKQWDNSGYLTLPTPAGEVGFATDKASLFLKLVLILALVFGFLRFARDVAALRRLRRGSFLLKRIGQVSLFACDQITIPFSYWRPGHAAVVIPNSLVACREEARMATLHELQHHRQGDTRWVHALWWLRLLCGLNPAARFWIEWISELQEFACDETLIGRNKVESRQYARCLVEVAQTAINQKGMPACATGLALLGRRNLLKRRIEKMFSHTKNGRLPWAFGTLTLALLTVTAFASQGLIQDRRVTMLEAQKMAANTRGAESEFPVVVNDLVLTQLNRFIGTADGREFMKNALQRMESHRALIESKIGAYDVPIELLAVPIVESGYQNLAQSSNKAHGAGLWMFIQSSARNYGLKVNEQVDERLNIDLETDAAMRYLKAERLRFKDWLLALLSYNMGENKVQRGITQTGSRDAWTLIRNGFEGDKNYLPKLMAAILILKNPETIR